MVFLLAAIVIILLAARTVAGFVIDYQWWSEMRQVSTWLDMMLYSVAPVSAGALVLFVVLWVAMARGMKFSNERLGAHRMFAGLATLLLLVIAVVLSAALVDSWTVVRYAGSRGIAPSAWHDPVFGHALGFYFFALPFYSMLLRFLLVAAVGAAVVYWLSARIWQLGGKLKDLGGGGQVDLSDLRLAGGLESRFLRGVGALFLVALAVRFCLDRYDTLVEDHGFLVGADWVAVHLSIPLLYACAAASVLAALAVLAGRYRYALLLPLVLLVQFALPRLVGSVYVRPNEISLERPYIARHIEATRSAYGLSTRTREIDFPAKMDAPIDPSKHQVLLSNVRLWPSRAFHDTVSQIQSLRTYYVFPNSDVDRYQIDGQLRQVLLTPREIDVKQLGNQGSTRWINSHFIYTHGYGLVMASANRITPDGMPVFYIQDVPPVVNTPSLKVTRPEIYFGEATTQPVFVHTGQPEFNYPAGSDNVHTRYQGKGGFPVGSFAMRMAAALSEGEWNILLTGYLRGESRMMIHRKVVDRIETLAPFVDWDSDPYLVLTSEGRLVWIVDGFTTSDSHPYSREAQLQESRSVNYIRNSVKATVDAYDGETKLYIFDDQDPVIESYARLFPRLFTPSSEMPADLRSHIRYPGDLFRLQAEIYRVYHMQDPEAFYNKEDIWDLAQSTTGPTGGAETVSPNYMVATLPDSDRAEFLVMLPFTPRNKRNLIGVMMARCDGAQYGEKVVLKLSKQAQINGPMQVDASINQDQNISKDLTLWNQHGSTVLRGQMMLLPVGNTFLYVDPIYIQASEASMPQLKKVAMAIGNRIIYADNYDLALQQLTGQELAAAPLPPGATASTKAIGTAAQPVDPKLERIRGLMKAFREQMGQGKWSEAGQQLEAIERELGGK